MIFARFFSATLVALLLLPACGPHYKRNKVPPLTQTSCAPVIKNDIEISAHHMNRTEIQQTFGSRGRKLGYYGLCPIQLSIKNNGTESVLFDPAQVSIPYADHADVAYCLQNRTALTTTSLLGIGLLATGAVYLATLPFVVWYQITGFGTLMYVGFGAATGLLVLTPTISIYYAKQAQYANRMIAQDIKDVAVSHARSIPAGQELEVILFTKKENCKKDFTVSLINEANQEVTTFNIAL